MLMENTTLSNLLDIEKPTEEVELVKQSNKKVKLISEYSDLAKWLVSDGAQEPYKVEPKRKISYKEKWVGNSQGDKNIEDANMASLYSKDESKDRDDDDKESSIIILSTKDKKRLR